MNFEFLLLVEFDAKEPTYRNLFGRIRFNAARGSPFKLFQASCANGVTHCHAEQENQPGPNLIPPGKCTKPTGLALVHSSLTNSHFVIFGRSKFGNFNAA
jgi:hypothetical protein